MNYLINQIISDEQSFSDLYISFYKTVKNILSENNRSITVISIINNSKNEEVKNTFNPNSRRSYNVFSRNIKLSNIAPFNSDRNNQKEKKNESTTKFSDIAWMDEVKNELIEIIFTLKTMVKDNKDIKEDIIAVLSENKGKNIWKNKFWN